MSIATQLQKALAFEQTGQLAEAVRGYEKVLGREPSNTDALFLLGRAYCQTGRFQDGAALFQKIIALNPKHAPAHVLLGRVLAQGGAPQEAIASYDRAIAADPKFAMAFANKADALDALGRRDEAVEVYDKALAIDPSNVAAWCNRGSALQELDRHAEAVESFQRALALRPNMAEIHFNLGNALRELKRHDEAVAQYRRAIALQPRFTDAYVNLATVLTTLFDWEAAVQCCETVGKLRPDAIPYFTLGYAQFQLGQYEPSVASFDKLLALDPDNSEAMAQKARALYFLGRLDDARSLINRAAELGPDIVEHDVLLAELKQFKPGDPRAEGAVQRLRNASSDDALQSMRIRFALAQLYAQIGQHEESFQSLLEANALVRQRIDYDVDAAVASMARTRQAFTSAFLRSKGGGDPSKKPIFIVGMPRSGTTLTEQILAAHPHVYGAGEIGDFEQCLVALREFAPSDYPDAVLDMTPAELSQLGAAYVAQVSKLAPAADRITNKHLGNSLAHVGLMHLALPNARFIYLRRDPVDTCMSCFSLYFQGPVHFAYDLRELGLMYRAHEDLAAHWRDVLPPGVFLDVQYEDIVEDIETQARRIVAHCGLEWDDACLAFHKADRPVRTASAAQVRQPIYRSSVGRWRPYRKQLQPLFEALGVDPDEV